jgi:hypothetical protein
MRVLVLDGEEIIGGMQNRIVIASFLVGAHTTLPIPVTCVEHGRWHPASASERSFSSGESTYYSLKREKHAQVHASLRSSGAHTSDQGAVWNAIAERQTASRVASSTGAMHDIYTSRRESLEEYLRAFPYVENAVGFAVALGGGMAGADIFDQPATARTLWPKLVRSYALDALDAAEGGTVARDRADRLLERTRDARCETFATLGLGEDVRLEGDGVIGGGLVYDETPIHITLFRTHEGDTSAQSSMISRASLRRTNFMQRSSNAMDTE